MTNINHTLALLLAIFSILPAFGKGVVYNDYSIPLPEGKSMADLRITEEDLQLTDKYIDNYPEGLVYADNQTLHKLYDYYRNDPEGKKEWAGIQRQALKAIPAWDIGKLIQKRYIYSIAYLKTFSLLYIFTGNELVSDFVRGHIAKVAELPIDFWIHAELRKLYPEKPQGYIETSYVNEAFSLAFGAVGRNMTPLEYDKGISAWREKGYKPGLNWLEAHPEASHNFTAVIANGVMYAAKYLKDEAGFAVGLHHMKMYLENCVLSDGSNYEGYSYFDYPMGQVLNASLVMTPEQIHHLVDGCGLSKSMQWRMSGMLMGEYDGHLSDIRLTFGDNPSAKPSWNTFDQSTWLCYMTCSDPLAAWIVDKWHQRRNSKVLLLDSKLAGTKIEPRSPEEIGIPLMTSYLSGDCYIRSGWTDDEVVLALKQMNGNRAEKRYPHQRPEVNSIQLGAFGDYIICNAASASYRSPIRDEHDIRSWRANVITVDGLDQLMPYGWFKKLGSYGYPDARIVRRDTLPDGGFVISNEARDAYATPMKQATRTVRYVPNGRFFIMKDALVPEDGASHRFDHRLFIFNRDNATVFSKTGQSLKVSRPKSDLYIAMQSSSKLNLEYRDAYIHGLKGRDYDPGGPNEGKPGSAIGLQWSCDARSLEVVSVLYPKHPGEPAPKIKFSRGKVIVDGVDFNLNDF